MLYKPHLETEIVTHCNLACAQCSHHSPYAAREEYPIDEFTRDVQQLARVMRVGDFKILGGEPLVSSHIADYITAVRRSGITQKIRLVTNGILLRKIDRDLFDQIDLVEVSFYPLAAPLYEIIKKNIERLQEYNADKVRVYTISQFRLTSQVFKNTDATLVNTIWQNCTTKDKIPAIYRGFYFKCIPSQHKGHFLKAVNGACDEKLLDPATDGVSLYADDFPQNLYRYLKSTTPLYACQFCMGTSGKLVDHGQKQDAEYLIRDLGQLRASLEFPDPRARKRQMPGLFRRVRGYAISLARRFRPQAVQ
jgi:organic radical activating enzyme